MEANYFSTPPSRRLRPNMVPLGWNYLFKCSPLTGPTERAICFLWLEVHRKLQGWSEVATFFVKPSVIQNQKERKKVALPEWNEQDLGTYNHNTTTL